MKRFHTTIFCSLLVFSLVLMAACNSKKAIPSPRFDGPKDGITQKAPPPPPAARPVTTGAKKDRMKKEESLKRQLEYRNNGLELQQMQEKLAKPAPVPMSPTPEPQMEQVIDELVEEQEALVYDIPEVIVDKDGDFEELMFSIEEPVEVEPKPTVDLESSSTNITETEPDSEDPAPQTEPFNREEYNRIYENPFQSPLSFPLSTFSIDVDVASYANVRRYLSYNQLPPADAVRIEELINYFDYQYVGPKDQHPFAIHTELVECPWKTEHYLLHVALKGREINREQLPPSNLVFLLDVSGSMNDPRKLPLLKQSFSRLLDNLDARDKVAIVVYAGNAGLVLPSTSAGDKGTILDALNKLQAGGSTAGGQGIQLAYKVAQDHFMENGNNRVILATDGDFNVGVSSQGELVRLIEEKRESGVFLSVLGFGTGNYQDSKMEMLADKGNGNYAYIDNLQEAEKVLVQQMAGTLFAIAKDVKLQLEFNPYNVKGYRLIGYENRMLAAEDFDDDTKDAGELGVGHTVTALYEIIPPDAETKVRLKNSLKYQHSQQPYQFEAELCTIKFRYKAPDADSSQLLSKVVSNEPVPIEMGSENMRFATAVAAWGMILRRSEHKGDATLEMVMNLGRAAKGADQHGYRSEFLTLVEQSRAALERQKKLEENELARGKGK